MANAVVNDVLRNGLGWVRLEIALLIGALIVGA